MHAVTRTYSGPGAGALFDLLDERKQEVGDMMRSIPGFVSYSLVRTGDGGVSITICDDEAGVQESARRARDWVSRNAGDLGTGAPKVSEGPVILHLG